MMDGWQNVEKEFLDWWKSKDFSGSPWTREEVQLIALLAWRDSRQHYEKTGSPNVPKGQIEKLQTATSLEEIQEALKGISREKLARLGIV